MVVPMDVVVAATLVVVIALPGADVTRRHRDHFAAGTLGHDAPG
jgi:hypothetical protein